MQILLKPKSLKRNCKDEKLYAFLGQRIYLHMDVYLTSCLELPGKQVDGQAVHSLKGVTMQSFLQGRKQGRTLSGREESEHLSTQRNSGLKFSSSLRR